VIEPGPEEPQATSELAASPSALQPTAPPAPRPAGSSPRGGAPAVFTKIHDFFAGDGGVRPKKHNDHGF
jgi:hypothetical protein